MSGGSRLNMGVAIRILAALLLGCFMLPSFGVSGGAHSAEITGIALLTGAETGGGQRLPANLAERGSTVIRIFFCHRIDWVGSGVCGHPVLFGRFRCTFYCEIRIAMQSSGICPGVDSGGCVLHYVSQPGFVYQQNVFAGTGLSEQTCSGGFRVQSLPELPAAHQARLCILFPMRGQSHRQEIMRYNGR